MAASTFVPNIANTKTHVALASTSLGDSMLLEADTKVAMQDKANAIDYSIPSIVNAPNILPTCLRTYPSRT